MDKRVDTQTQPRQGWLADVLSAAGATVEQAAPYRDMLNRWYNAGEPVSIAAVSLRSALRGREEVEVEERKAGRARGVPELRSIVESCNRLIEQHEKAGEVYGRPTGKPGGGGSR